MSKLLINRENNVHYKFVSVSERMLHKEPLISPVARIQ